MIKNLALNTFRQRLLTEGFYTINISKKNLETYLLNVAEPINLRMYSKPIVFVPTLGVGKGKMQDTMHLFH